MEIKEKGFMHLPMRRAVKLTLSPIERGKDSVDLPNPIPNSVFSRWNNTNGVNRSNTNISWEFEISCKCTKPFNFIR